MLNKTSGMVLILTLIFLSVLSILVFCLTEIAQYQRYSDRVFRDLIYLERFTVKTLFIAKQQWAKSQLKKCFIKDKSIIPFILKSQLDWKLLKSCQYDTKNYEGRVVWQLLNNKKDVSKKIIRFWVWGALKNRDLHRLVFATLRFKRVHKFFKLLNINWRFV